MFSEKDYIDALTFCKKQEYLLDNVGVVTRIRPRPNYRAEGLRFIEVVRLSTFLRLETREYCSESMGLYHVSDNAEYSCCEPDDDGDVDLKFYTQIGDVVLIDRDTHFTGHPYAIVKNIRHEMMLENLKKAKNKVFGNLVENQKKK